MHNEAMMVACLAMIALLLVRDLAPQLVDGVWPVEPDKKPESKPWEALLVFKKGGGSAPAPDPNIGIAAVKQAELGEDWLEFAKEQFGVANQRQDKLDEMTKRVTDQQLAAQDKAVKWGDEDRATGQKFLGKYSDFGDSQLARYKSTFQPIEDKIASDAANWDSEERMTEEAAKAKGTALSNIQAQRESRNRELASMGVSPASGRSAAASNTDSINAALAATQAENGARDGVRQQAQQLRSNAANIGQNINANGMQATNLGLASAGLGTTNASLGLNAGSTALGNSLSNQASWANNANIMNSGFQGAMSGYGNQANILNAQYGNQLSAWNSQQQANAAGFGGLMSGVGTMAGAMMMSSRKLKEDKKPIPDGALDAMNSMPVESWKYKDGVADGGYHIGPYAEDFQKATGKGDGHSIPIVDAIGVTMKAVQELDQKVEKLGRGLAR